MRAVIFHADPRRPWLADRSVRSLKAAGIQEISLDENELVDDSACLILRAGLVLHSPFTFRAPSVAGNIMAVGLCVSWNPDSPWSRFQSLHGGIYPAENLPAPLCEWHSSGRNARARLQGTAVESHVQIVHWARLDHMPDDPRLFVMEVITSLQHGGAERIACDLASHLNRHHVRSRLVVLGKPNRKPLPAPSDTLDLSCVPYHQRIECLTQSAISSGADVLHLHLANAADTRALSSSGIPVITTVHNSRAGWPQGLESLKKDDCALFLACSQAAGDELRGFVPEIPVRTVWNGIDPNFYPETLHLQKGAQFTLACIANPRRQKRLELLPAILAATERELVARGVVNPTVKLIIAGEVSPNLPDAMDSHRRFMLEAEKHRLTNQIRWTDGAIPVREILAKSHALVSCSAHEGLSLAHLEAVSSGLPVIACDTGGTRELAWRNPAVTLLAADAGAAEFASALTDALLTPPPSGHAVVWRDFSTGRMAHRVSILARQVACRPNHPGETLWFITNNLSTGGAQTSLKHLLKQFQLGGKRVRVALLQEYPEHPTHGRLELLEFGIDVFVPPPAGLIAPQDSVDLILAEITADPPAVVVFWNAIMTHKLLLADALPFTKVHDISPGEMWYASLDRYLENPLPGVPCRTGSDYGKLLSSMVVKYAGEAPRAAALGVPVRVIPNGVAIPEARRHRVIGDRFVFGTAARISPQKCLDELIEAFRLTLVRLPDAILKIAGGIETGAEEYAARLKEEAKDLPIEWLGEIRDLSEFHQACDAFVMISDPAGCPNASLEALAAGLPVIATDIGGASEQVIDGITGLLVPPRDSAAFSNAMVELSGNEALRTSMETAAREHMLRHFTLERMTAEYLDLFIC